MFALAQYGELFVIAAAIWICFCNFAAGRCAILRRMAFNWPVTRWRSSASRQPFNRMEPIVWWEARFTEIVLGIICAAVVSRLFFVRELSPNLVELVHSLTRRADRFVTALLDADADRARVADERNVLINDYVTALAMQQSAYFESAEAMT
ncbi:MAG TPA: FUSC family protein [Xanthobacteraceae bacterium]|nr:FUSC family protein [Xanthobacteraceae bacterium]